MSNKTWSAEGHDTETEGRDMSWLSFSGGQEAIRTWGGEPGTVH